MSIADRVPAADMTLPALALGGGLAVWWTATAVLALPAFVLPSPGAVLAQLLTAPGLYARSAAATLSKVVVGGGVGVAGGVLVAVLVSRSTLVRRSLFPYLVALRVLPKVAVAPLLLLYVGMGFGTAVVFVALVSFFPMAVSTVAGLNRIPERQLDLLRSVDASGLRTFLEVEVPYAVPDVFAGLKQSVTLAVIGGVVAEWVVSTSGLGYLILIASENVQVAVMLSAVLVLVGIGLCLYAGVVAVQRRVDYATGAR